MRRVLMAVMLGWLLAAPAMAVQPDEILADSSQEGRARALSAQLRCLVCQNQSIDDSDAPLARDLRLLVRERITAGDDDTAVMSYVVARFGEFVLLKPPFRLGTLMLWLTPVLALLAGVWLARGMSYQRRVDVGRDALSAHEQKKLDDLMRKDV